MAAELAFIAPRRLSEIAKHLRDGDQPESPTVREFLSWFSAHRRGFWIVENIRDALSKAGLRTEPDFESAFIDSEISFVLAKPDAADAISNVVELQGNISAKSGLSATLSVFSDPTYRISKLAAANTRPFSVVPDAALAVATTLMLAHDFSQLPVMTSDREVKGVITWQSVGSKLALGGEVQVVRDAMENHHEIRADASLFDAIPTIVAQSYVLIRAADQKISGIVTATDLSLQFKQLAEPFLLIGEIESQLRRIIALRLPLSDVMSCVQFNGLPSQRAVNNISDLAFGDYVRILENPDRWSQSKLQLDRTEFCRLLNEVRETRNDVMHFDPDGITQDKLRDLRNFVSFLSNVAKMKT